jgi:acetylornithine deacetylase/succinyl-diaminopimelate desuccinylase-like protein
LIKREIVKFLRRSGLVVTLADARNSLTAPPLETDTSLPLVRQFLGCLGQKRGAGVDFFTDAGVLGAAGIPSVVFGPGSIAQAHTVDEWVALKQLQRGVTLLGKFLGSLA